MVGPPPPRSFTSFPGTAPTFPSFPASKVDEKSSKRHRKTNEDSDSDRRDRKSRKTKDSKPLVSYASTNLIASSSKGKDRQHEPKYESKYEGLSMDSIMSKSTAKSSQISNEKSYTIDSNGDNANRQYSSLDKGKISDYRRAGAGYVTGAPKNLRIERETAYSRRGIVLSEPQSRYTEDSNKLTSVRYKRILFDPASRIPMAAELEQVQAVAQQFNNDFVALLPEVESELSEDEFEQEQDYRSTKTAKKSETRVSGEERGGESHLEYIQRKDTEFGRLTEANPSDISTWLAFVIFQDEVHSPRLSKDFLQTKRAQKPEERKGANEKKLSILDRAINHPKAPSNQSNIALRLAYMTSGAEVWESAELDTKWQELLQRFPGEQEIWMAYLNFQQTHAESFSVPNLISIYHSGLGTLVQSTYDMPTSGGDRTKAEKMSVYLLLRAALFCKEAGFPEQAMAIFQANLELNLFRPAKLGEPPSHDGKLGRLEREWAIRIVKAFEDFWESEAPRIGEPDAVGWTNTKPDADSPVDTSSPAENLPRPFNYDPFTHWYELEVGAQNRLKRPLRLVDDAAEEDPQRIVNFIDIKPFLIFLRSNEARLQLIYSFLTLLGLPLTPPGTSSNHVARADSFTQSMPYPDSFWPNASTSSRPFDVVGGEAMEAIRLAGVSTPFSIPMRAFPSSPELLYSAEGRSSWFTLLDKDTTGSINSDTVRNTFAQTHPAVQSTFLTLSSIATEACTNLKAAIKLAKSHLKSDQQNLQLWISYAQLERSRGKTNEARTVFITALSMYTAFDGKRQIDAPLLWRSLAELEWDEGNDIAALVVLVCASEGANTSIQQALAKNERPSPTRILAARKYWSSTLEEANSPDALDILSQHRLTFCFNYALFQHLTINFEASTAVFKSQLEFYHLENDDSMESEEEQMWALYAKVLFRETTTKQGFKPATIRDAMDQALTRYPSNSIFFSMYFFNELRTRIQNRVRKVVDEKLLRNDQATVLRYLYGIYAELHLSSRGYNAAAVRNLFERAVSNSRTKASLTIWTLYVKFEIREKQLARARRLLYTALHECPWAKSLYLMPFQQPLRSAFSTIDLKTFYGSMLQKGLRISVPLQPLLQGWVEPDQTDDFIMEALQGETEDERYARMQQEDTVKLMPY